MRITIYVPDELGEQVRSADMNVSAVAQEALRQRLGCDHDRLSCVDCGDDVSGQTIVGSVLGRFYRELLWSWEPLVDRGGTAVGAATVAKSVAMRFDVPDAESLPLPRPSRSMREAS